MPSVEVDMEVPSVELELEMPSMGVRGEGGFEFGGRCHQWRQWWRWRCLATLSPYRPIALSPLLSCHPTKCYIPITLSSLSSLSSYHPIMLYHPITEPLYHPVTLSHLALALASAVPRSLSLRQHLSLLNLPKIAILIAA